MLSQNPEEDNAKNEQHWLNFKYQIEVKTILLELNQFINSPERGANTEIMLDLKKQVMNINELFIEKIEKKESDSVVGREALFEGFQEAIVNLKHNISYTLCYSDHEEQKLIRHIDNALQKIRAQNNYLSHVEKNVKSYNPQAITVNEVKKRNNNLKKLLEEQHNELIKVMNSELKKNYTRELREIDKQIDDAEQEIKKFRGVIQEAKNEIKLAEKDKKNNIRKLGLIKKQEEKLNQIEILNQADLDKINTMKNNLEYEKNKLAEDQKYQKFIIQSRMQDLGELNFQAESVQTKLEKLNIEKQKLNLKIEKPNIEDLKPLSIIQPDHFIDFKDLIDKLSIQVSYMTEKNAIKVLEKIEDQLYQYGLADKYTSNLILYAMLARRWLVSAKKSNPLYTHLDLFLQNVYVVGSLLDKKEESESVKQAIRDQMIHFIKMKSKNISDSFEKYFPNNYRIKISDAKTTYLPNVRFVLIGQITNIKKLYLDELKEKKLRPNEVRQVLIQLSGLDKIENLVKNQALSINKKLIESMLTTELNYNGQCAVQIADYHKKGLDIDAISCRGKNEPVIEVNDRRSSCVAAINKATASNSSRIPDEYKWCEDLFGIASAIKERLINGEPVSTKRLYNCALLVDSVQLAVGADDLQIAEEQLERFTKLNDKSYQLSPEEKKELDRMTQTGIIDSYKGLIKQRKRYQDELNKTIRNIFYTSIDSKAVVLHENKNAALMQKAYDIYRSGLSKMINNDSISSVAGFRLLKNMTYLNHAIEYVNKENISDPQMIIRYLKQQFELSPGIQLPEDELEEISILVLGIPPKGQSDEFNHAIRRVKEQEKEKIDLMQDLSQLYIKYHNQLQKLTGKTLAYQNQFYEISHKIDAIKHMFFRVNFDFYQPSTRRKIEAFKKFSPNELKKFGLEKENEFLKIAGKIERYSDNYYLAIKKDAEEKAAARVEKDLAEAEKEFEEMLAEELEQYEKHLEEVFAQMQSQEENETPIIESKEKHEPLSSYKQGIEPSPPKLKISSPSSPEVKVEPSPKQNESNSSVDEPENHQKEESPESLHREKKNVKIIPPPSPKQNESKSIVSEEEQKNDWLKLYIDKRVGELNSGTPQQMMGFQAIRNINARYFKDNKKKYFKDGKIHSLKEWIENYKNNYKNSVVFPNSSHEIMNLMEKRFAQCTLLNELNILRSRYEKDNQTAIGEDKARTINKIKALEIMVARIMKPASFSTASLTQELKNIDENSTGKASIFYRGLLGGNHLIDLAKKIQTYEANLLDTIDPAVLEEKISEPPVSVKGERRPSLFRPRQENLEKQWADEVQKISVKQERRRSLEATPEEVPKVPTQKKVIKG